MRHFLIILLNGSQNCCNSTRQVVASPSFLILFSLQYAICWVTNMCRRSFRLLIPSKPYKRLTDFGKEWPSRFISTQEPSSCFFLQWLWILSFFYMARSSVDDIPGKGVLSLHQPITPSALVSGRHYQHICCKTISCNGATRRRDGCGFTGLGRFWSTHCRPSNNFDIWAAVKKKKVKFQRSTSFYLFLDTDDRKWVLLAFMWPQLRH